MDPKKKVSCSDVETTQEGEHGTKNSLQVLGRIGKGDLGTVYLVTRSSLPEALRPRNAVQEQEDTMSQPRSAEESSDREGKQQRIDPNQKETKEKKTPPVVTQRHQRLDPNQVVALKVASKEDIERRKKLGRIQTEYDILRLQHVEKHPCLVDVQFTIATPKYLFTGMRPYLGGPLHRAVLANCPGHRFPDESVTKFVAAEVVLALEFLHSKGIVHRDIKPENILVDGSTGHVVLSDFDLCQAQTQKSSTQRFTDPATTTQPLPLSSPAPKRRTAGGATGSTGTGGRERRHSFVGTPEYMSPELVHDRPHSGAMDLWALGVLLYECSLGFTPFKGSTEADTLHRIRQHWQNPPPPPQAAAGGDLDDDYNDDGEEAKEPLVASTVKSWFKIASSANYALKWPTQQGSGGGNNSSQQQQQQQPNAPSAPQVSVEDRGVPNLQVPFPVEPVLSDSLKDLIRRLLNPNPRKRPTVQAVKSHAWFSGGGKGGAGGQEEASINFYTLPDQRSPLVRMLGAVREPQPVDEKVVALLREEVQAIVAMEKHQEQEEKIAAPNRDRSVDEVESSSSRFAFYEPVLPVPQWKRNTEAVTEALRGGGVSAPPRKKAAATAGGGDEDSPDNGQSGPARTAMIGAGRIAKHWADRSKDRAQKLWDGVERPVKSWWKW